MLTRRKSHEVSAIKDHKSHEEGDLLDLGNMVDEDSDLVGRTPATTPSPKSEAFFSGEVRESVRVSSPASSAKIASTIRETHRALDGDGGATAAAAVSRDGAPPRAIKSCRRARRSATSKKQVPLSNPFDAPNAMRQQSAPAPVSPMMMPMMGGRAPPPQQQQPGGMMAPSGMMPPNEGMGDHSAGRNL